MVEQGPYEVPQGSILGSKFFVIYENYLPAASPHPDAVPVSLDGTCSPPLPPAVSQTQDDDNQHTLAYVDDSNAQFMADTPAELMTKI